MLQKFFQYSRKLEELQTVRKAKEVDEIRKFDVQMEAQKQRNLDQHLKSEHEQATQRIHFFEHPPISLETWMTSQMQHLQAITEFDEQAQHSKTEASDIDFERLWELQQNGTEDQPENSTSLFSATHDVFVNEISEITESELQRELRQNDEAIYENQERPTSSQTTKPELDLHKTALEEKLTILDHDLPPDPSEKVDEGKKTQPSSGNVFYFRQISPPSKK